MTRDIDLQAWDTEVFILARETRKELLAAARDLLAFLDSGKEPEPGDLAFTLNRGLRGSDSLRLSVVAASIAELKKKLAFAAERLGDPGCRAIQDRSGIFFFEEPLIREGTAAFVFPGEGSQYPGMFGDLCRLFPEVRACFDRADRVFLESGKSPLVSEVLFPAPSPDGKTDSGLEAALWQMDFAVNAVFNAVNAMHTLLESLKIRPAAVVGHSSGEFSALLAAGALPLRDKGQLVRYGKALSSFSDESIKALVPPAKFLTVGGAGSGVVEEVLRESRGDLAFAMDNCPNQAIICGSDPGEVAGAMKTLQKKGAICSYLPFERAYHTEKFAPVCERFTEFFEKVDVAPPKRVIYSCATAEPYPTDPVEIKKLAVEQWARPVRFRETIEAMYEAGARIFVEVGPRDNLTGFVKDILAKRRYLAFPSNVPFRSGITQLNLLVGLLAAHGVPMELGPLYARRNPRRVPLGGEEESGGKKKKRAAIVMTLPLHIPKLEVGDDVAAEVLSARAKKEAALTAEAKAAARAVLPAGEKGKPLAQEPAPAEEEEEEKADPRLVMMRDHMKTMERFLEAQEQVITAFREKRARRGFAAAPRAEPPSAGRAPRPAAASSPAEKTSAAEASSPCGPFRVAVLSMKEGESLRAECLFDLEEDLYLWDHTLGSDLSAYDPTLQGLPVVPLTMSAELQVQAAALLCPGRKPIGMKDVGTYQWVEVEEGGTTKVLITARKVARGREEAVAVRILKPEAAALLDKGEELGLSSIYNEGTVIFGDAYPHPPKDPLPDLEKVEAYTLPPERFYKEVMFHGPAFDGIASIERMGGNGVDATLVNPIGVSLFRSHPEPSFLTDPVLLDIAGQLLGFWMVERLEEGFVGFPFGFKGLDFYVPPSTLGRGPFKCVSRITDLSRDLYRADIIVTDGGGRPLFGFKDWSDRRTYEWSRAFVRYFHHPCAASFCEAWPGAEALAVGAGGVKACRCRESGGEFWKKVAAYISLGRREREEYFGVKGIEKRRREWLMGRIAAKDAVRLFLKERFGVDACPADIEIVADAAGRPAAAGRLIEDLGCSVVLSITHYGRAAAAAACDGSAAGGIGFDVEPIEGRHEGLEKAAFAAGEREFLSDPGTPEGKERLLRLWCAKEAVAKALGTGFMGTPLNLAVQGADRSTGRITIRLAGGLARRFPRESGRAFEAATGREGELIFALAVT